MIASAIAQVQQNELISLALAIGVLVFVQANRTRLERTPRFRILQTGFYLMVAASIITVLEEFLWGDFLNLAEHGCYTVSVILTAIWCWQAFGSRGANLD
jgi:hypothetical protein